MGGGGERDGLLFFLAIRLGAPRWGFFYHSESGHLRSPTTEGRRLGALSVAGKLRGVRVCVSERERGGGCVRSAR